MLSKVEYDWITYIFIDKFYLYNIYKYIYYINILNERMVYKYYLNCI